MNKFRQILVIVCGMLPVLAQGAIYRWVDDQGKAHYSDKPQYEGSEYLLDEQTKKAIAEQIRQQDEAAKANDILQAMAADDWQWVARLLPVEQLNAPLDPKRSYHTPLTYAVSENKPQLFRWLLSLNPAMDEPNLDNKTPLFYAVQRDDGFMVHNLVQRGADPNQEVLGGNRLLHDSIERRHFEAMEQLLAGKAQVDAMNPRNETPLRLAVLLNQVNTCGLLLAFGANPKLKALDGRTPYDLALKNGQVPILSLMQNTLNGQRPSLTFGETEPPKATTQ